MGFLEDAKGAAEGVADKIGKAVEDRVDRTKDKFEELQADVDVKRAELHRDVVHKKNDVKKDLRD